MTTSIHKSSNDATFSQEELSRYNRHITIPSFGIEAQTKLKNARVLVIGAGGLGSPVLLYLAAAGVGTIGIIDFDRVDDSNLQRQVLYGIEDLGQPKVEAAKKRLNELNPFIKIEIFNEILTNKNALKIFEGYDVIADGSDNFQTRYLVNDAAVILGIPLVYASILQFEGQLSVFNYTDKDSNVGPNYRDLYPTPPEAGSIPSCAEGGVLGVLPGIIGTLQATEVIKVITGIGELLAGKLMLFDALTMNSRVLKYAKNPQSKPITQLIDYDLFCGTTQVVKEITVDELLAAVASNEALQIIDVREQEEYALKNIGAQLIPLQTVLDNHQKIDPSKKVIVHCKSGRRSAAAIEQLQHSFSFQNLYNLVGGIEALSPEQIKQIIKN